MTANCLRSRFKSRANMGNESPFEVWNGNSPLLAILETFGCHAYVYLSSPKRQKLDARSVRYRFVGYSEHKRRIDSKTSQRVAIFISRDATFPENVFDDGPSVVDKCVNAGLVDRDRITTDVNLDSESGIDTSAIPADDNENFPGGTGHICGAKRNSRSQSLERVTDTPQPKRSCAATMLTTSLLSYLSVPHSAHVVCGRFADNLCVCIGIQRREQVA